MSKLFIAKVFAVSTLLFLNVSHAFAQDSIYRLPAGTRVVLKMDVEINSSSASVDDTFTATVAKAVRKRDVAVLEPGVVIEGRVTAVSDAAYGDRSGSMELLFETIRFDDGDSRSIEGVLVEKLEPPSRRTESFLTILGSAAAGMLAGIATGADGGHLIGAGIGAGAGSGAVLIRKGREVRIRTGEEFEIELKREVFLPVREF